MLVTVGELVDKLLQKGREKIVVVRGFDECGYENPKISEKKVLIVDGEGGVHWGLHRDPDTPEEEAVALDVVLIDF
jgi:hypothetical protein